MAYNDYLLIEDSKECISILNYENARYIAKKLENNAFKFIIMFLKNNESISIYTNDEQIYKK